MKTSLLKMLFLAFLLLTSFSSFSQVYARLEQEPDSWHYYDGWDYHEVHDYYIRFYSDASGTIPLTLSSPVSVNYRSDYTYATYSGTTYDHFNGYGLGQIGDTETYIGDRYDVLIMYNPNNPNEWESYDTAIHSLKPGTGYTIIY